MRPEEIYFAIITAIVGVFGLLFTYLQFRIARQKRKDDLFNIRYEFYSKISKVWISTYNSENPTLDIADLIPISEKAEFLFGKEIAEHIISLEGKRATHDLFPDDDFSKPFAEYLKLS